MSVTASSASTPPVGGGFLLATPPAAFSPEDFSDEQRQVQATVKRFLDEEILPRVGEMEAKDADLQRKLMRQAGELGLLGILVPEAYDGLEMDLTSQLIVAEEMGRYASFSVTYGAHAGIGTLPLVFFGTDEQKRRYLPDLVAANRLAAYCLSEPQAGSDALASRTRADLTADGKHYVLSGQKMWISNGAWADLYTVFAKVDGEKFTAFLVERETEGVQPGAEEHKMGIRGSSTTALYLDNVKVPAENLLGEIGRGHIIAFNILNLGRLKLASSCVGGAKEVLVDVVRYAKERKAFGTAIANFGAIREKLAESAIRTWAAESMTYRTGGLIDARLEGLSWGAADAPKTVLKAIEEYAPECALCKVFSTEALDFVVDEGVQIHGGYGFHQDYAVERAYRDSRINRIFEGTNEINRLLSVSMLLKRAGQGRLDLMSAVTELIARLSSGEVETRTDNGGPLAGERIVVERMRKIALLGAGVAFQRFSTELEKQQEIVGALADILVGLYALESCVLRADKLAARGKGEAAIEMTRAFAVDALAHAGDRAATALAASVEGPKLDQYWGALRRLTRVAPVNTVALRRSIAERVIAAEKYVV